MYYKSDAPVAFQWILDIALQDDFNSIIYQNLIHAGYEDANREKAVYQYYNLCKRQIEAKPRQVLRSKEFVCPTGYEEALREFIDKAESGASLTPFQSQKIKQSAYNDLLLNDWGIQHFHLTRRFRDDGFATRSQYQIFAYVTDRAIYLIQTYPHNAKNLYSKREMVKILRDNWPEVTERFHIKEMTELTEKLDDHTYGKVREAHAFTMLELGRNEVYYPIGGGITSSGYSVSALREADFWMNRLGAFQLCLKDNAEWIGKMINQGKDTVDKCCFMKIKLLWIDNADKVTLCEVNSGMIIQLNAKENWLRICKAHELFR